MTANSTKILFVDTSFGQPHLNYRSVIDL
ncbi:uncharacterized protein METZ01_LOCUS106424 [marine metagenome]|uniref:Uncharacterized protein n=1 Tax=marine metagenome TaxID=408172 RepID=A0A381WM39_9ZZZZ